MVERGPYPTALDLGEAATQSHLLKIQFVVAATYAEIYHANVSDAGE